MFTDEQKQKWELHWRQSWETDKVWIKCMNIPGLIDTILNCHKQSPHPLTTSSCSSTLTHNMLAFFFMFTLPVPPAHIYSCLLWLSASWDGRQTSLKPGYMQSGHGSKKLCSQVTVQRNQSQWQCRTQMGWGWGWWVKLTSTTQNHPPFYHDHTVNTMLQGQTFT